MNILLTNAGRRNYFINFLSKLKKNYRLKIFVSDCNFNIPSFHTQDKIYKKIVTPKASSKTKYFNLIRYYNC